MQSMKYDEVVFNVHGVWFYKFKKGSLTPKTYQTKKLINNISFPSLFTNKSILIETYRSPGFLVQFFV